MDERFDPEKSTRAYARYMKFIYNQTGDWYLSMAGYNWGTGNVQRAVQKTGYADFWELYKRHNLPAETQNYVPEILAAIIIANHPAQYGFDDVRLDSPVLTDTVTINYPVDLHLVADLVGAPMEEMMALNPSLLHSITPPDTSFDLHLPAGTATLFTKRIAGIPEGKRLASRYHRVSSGDTLASVAHEFRLTAADLAAANQMGESDSLQGVAGLIIPQATVTVPAAASVAPSTHARLYTTRKGDTLVTIADRFGVSLNQLRRWNRISGSRVRPGRQLHVGDTASGVHAVESDHRHSDSQADANTREAAPVKGASRRSANAGTRDESDASTAKSRHGRSSRDAADTGRSRTRGTKKSRDRDQDSTTDSRARDQEPTKRTRGKSRDQKSTKHSRTRDQESVTDSRTRDQEPTKRTRGKSRDQESTRRSRTRDQDSATDSRTRDQEPTKRTRGKSRDQESTRRSKTRDQDSTADSKTREPESTRRTRSKSRDEEPATRSKTREKTRDQEPVAHAKTHARKRK